MSIKYIYIREFLLLLSVKVILELLYIKYVVQFFSYAGFIYDFSLNKYLSGWLIYLVGYTFLLTKKKVYIFEIYYILFLIYILPTIVYFSLANQGFKEFLILIFPYFIIVGLTFEKLRYNVKSLSKSKLYVLAFSFLAIGLVLFNYFVATGGQFVLNFEDVYDFREEFGNESSQGIFGYLNNWVTKIFLVLILGWALHNKNRLAIISCIIIFLLLFALSGHKGVLKGLALIYFFKFLYERKNIRYVILNSYLLLLVIVSSFFFLFDFQFFGSLLVRRLFFVPVFLNFTYIEFFTNNEFIYWSNGILSSFIQYPYYLGPTHLIGEYLGNSNMSANTGFLATGFMHFGYFGVFIYTVIATIIFNVINILIRKANKFIVITIIFIPAQSLFMGSDLFTVLLTHGLFVVILMLFLYNDKRYNLIFGSNKLKL